MAIIGAGSWGTALSIHAAHAGHSVHLWSRNLETVEQINLERVNASYLSMYSIPERVVATHEMHEALRGAECVLLAAPSHTLRELITRMLPDLNAQMLFISATKGIETQTGKRVSQILSEIVSKGFAPRFVCLSGPSFAQEVAAGRPTAVVAASSDLQDAQLVQRALSFENLRIYTNTDVVGTELGGSVKNVMAVAAGIVAGLDLGTNSVAALITRGLAEITRLALAQGARIKTLIGLAGMGDLVLTCTGNLSRNRYVGQELGRGRKLAEITGRMREVAEGINTTLAVKRLADKLDIEMPITKVVYEVLYEGKAAGAAAHELMTRPLRGEFED